MTPMLVTLRRAAHEYGIPEDRLGQLARKGEFPVLRLGREQFVKPEALMEWVEQNMCQSAVRPQALR